MADDGCVTLGLVGFVVLLFLLKSARVRSKPGPWATTRWTTDTRWPDDGIIGPDPADREDPQASQDRAAATPSEPPRLFKVIALHRPSGAWSHWTVPAADPASAADVVRRVGLEVVSIVGLAPGPAAAPLPVLPITAANDPSAPLVSMSPGTPESPATLDYEPSRPWVVVARLAGTVEAHLAASLLEANGINCRIAEGSADLAVRDADVPAAVELLHDSPARGRIDPGACRTREERAEA